MNFEIVELSDFSGSKATIYSIILDNAETTLLDHFIEENQNDFSSEVSDILQRLNAIGNDTGAREHFFKEREGKPGDGVCALYDSPDSKLRLYCIRYGNCAVIVGGGGPKSKSLKAFQENEKLTDENYMVREVSQTIIKALKEKDIRWSEDGMYLLGELNFTQDE